MDEKTKNRFTQDDYEIVEREVPYQGIFRLARYHLRYKLFNGDWSRTVLREVLERRSAVAVLPYDPNTDTVVLIEQFRPGALSNPQSPWLIEIVAGVLDNHGEPAEELAIREAKEEAGCEILDLYPICEYFVSPGGSNEYIKVFAGKVDASQVCGIHGLSEEDEDIRVTCYSADDAFKLLQQGEIRTSPAITSLLWLQLNREWLKQLWRTK